MNKLDTNSDLYKIRHSLAHVLAQAVLEIRPGAKLGFGPPVDNGFYYDFDLEEPLTPEDLPKLEKRMRHIIKSGQVFEREELDQEDMVELLSRENQQYKIEQVEDLVAQNEIISLYRNGPFWDLCEGPHVKSTSEIPKNCFSLDSLAGAYWKGSEKNNMMQRVYGLAFETGEQLKEYKEKRSLAMQRDHRKLNSKLRYFTISDEVGKGLPLWMPNGTVIRDELEKLAREKEFLAGYKRVSTPHITRDDLYFTSGHLPYYQESMFPPMEMDGERLFLKPMNCPHHHMIFKAEPRSYRDLPLRLAEYGTCYRYEQSGELAGLLRVRGMTMNDAHIYCTEDQFKDEFLAVCNLYLKYFEIFGIEKYEMRLSLHDEEGLGKKYVNEPKLWQKTEELVREALTDGGIHFKEVPGEAAFYGPKIDVQVWSAIGKEFTLATNQVDFAIPGRFGLTYKDSKGKDQVPLCIHRAPLSTHERFIGFLIEHYKGDFPLWLAPTQIAVLPVSEKANAYAEKVFAALKQNGFRAILDEKADKIGSKIRNAELQKINVMLVVGEKEAQSETVSLRRRIAGDKGSVALKTLIKDLQKEITERSA